MKKRVFSLSILLFLLIAIWIMSSVERKELHAKDKPVTTVQIAPDPGIVIMPEGPSLEATLISAENAALLIIRDHLRHRGVSYEGIESMEKLKELILNYFRAYSPTVGKTTAFLADEYEAYMKRIKEKLIDIRKCFAPNEKQIEKLVRVNLEPFLKRIDQHTK